MSGILKNMKDAVMGGEGGGLQSTSQIAGETMANNADIRGGDSKKADEATSSLGQFAKGSQGPTESGTSVKAADQIANQQTGSADHLGVGK